MKKFLENYYSLIRIIWRKKEKEIKSLHIWFNWSIKKIGFTDNSRIIERKKKEREELGEKIIPEFSNMFPEIREIRAIKSEK